MEMWCAARHCAFESHPLRHVKERRSFSGALVLFLVRTEVNAGDLAAVEDEINGWIFGVTVMMGITLILAWIALGRLSR